MIEDLEGLSGILALKVVHPSDSYNSSYRRESKFLNEYFVIMPNTRLFLSAARRFSPDTAGDLAAIIARILTCRQPISGLVYPPDARYSEMRYSTTCDPHVIMYAWSTSMMYVMSL
jgi:hypothetical protein